MAPQGPSGRVGASRSARVAADGLEELHGGSALAGARTLPVPGWPTQHASVRCVSSLWRTTANMPRHTFHSRAPQVQLLWGRVAPGGTQSGTVVGILPAL